MSELEKAESEAREWMREDTPIAPNSLYWSRVLAERDVLKGQLDAMEEALAAKDERIAELERSRPVGDWPEARRLRERAEALSQSEWVASVGVGGEDRGSHERARFHEALYDFLKSAPPASAPSDDLRAQLGERTRQVAQLQVDRDSALAQARSWRAEIDKMTKDHAAEGERWAREMGAKDAELRALKAAPARSEREVDAELRAALKACCEWTRPGTRILHALDRWLAAPLSAPDEYTRAAVAYAEAEYEYAENDRDDKFWRISDRFAKLWNARQRDEYHAPDGEKAAPASGRMTATDAAARELSKAAPAPADGERVTVYVKQYADGTLYGPVLSASEKAGHATQLKPGDRWLAIDARVVREGGA